MDARTDIKQRLPAASGGWTNAALHLPAIAHDVAEIFKKTPYVADSKPGGRDVAKDMFEIAGIPLLMKTLLENGHLHGDCLTVTGRTIAENLKSVNWDPHQDVVRSADKPITVTSGVIGLKGNLAPEGAIVKVAGMSKLQFTGPARRFDCEGDAFESVQRNSYKEGEGPVAVLQHGSTIEIDAVIGALNVKLTGTEPAERKTKWKLRETNHTSDVPGRAHEKQCYAVI